MLTTQPPITLPTMVISGCPCKLYLILSIYGNTIVLIVYYQDNAVAPGGNYNITKEQNMTILSSYPIDNNRKH